MSTVSELVAEEDAALLAAEAEGLGHAAIGRLGRKPNSVHGRLMTLARREARREREGA